MPLPKDVNVMTKVELLDEAETLSTELYTALKGIDVPDLTRLGVKYDAFNAFIPGSAKRLAIVINQLRR
jgi:hypothetical protein